MPSTSSDVFLDPDDKIAGTAGLHHGVVKVGSPRSTLNIFSRDPEQLEALGEACFDAARDLRASVLHEVA